MDNLRSINYLDFSQTTSTLYKGINATVQKYASWTKFKTYKMKNTLLFFLMTVLTISMSFGQNCDSIEAENQRLKTEVSELKEILLITTPIMEFQADDINI